MKLETSLFNIVIFSDYLHQPPDPTAITTHHPPPPPMYQPTSHSPNTSSSPRPTSHRLYSLHSIITTLHHSHPLCLSAAAITGRLRPTTTSIIYIYTECYSTINSLILQTKNPSGISLIFKQISLLIFQIWGAQTPIRWANQLLSSTLKLSQKVQQNQKFLIPITRKKLEILIYPYLMCVQQKSLWSSNR